MKLTLPTRALLALGALLVFSALAGGQDMTYNTMFHFEPTMVDRPPSIGNVHAEYSDDARKNGVEGTVKLSLTLGGDGHTHDVAIVDDLPLGVGQAVKKAIDDLHFEPATFRGKPQDIKATFTYKITLWYQDDDNDVKKVQLLSKPVATYPEQFRKEGTKGSVLVAVGFYSDGGKVEVIKSDSTMPAEFDAAAKEAAKDLKFTPAVHKKSKKPVNQVMWVTFPFKP